MPIYKCEKCEYQTKIKRLMNNHLNKMNPCKTEIVLMSKKSIEPKNIYDDIPSKESEESNESDESECEPVEPVKPVKPVKQIKPVSAPVSAPVSVPVKENPYLSFFNNQTKQENKNPRIKFV